VNALANEEVGKYLGEHCICAYQKIGTFRIVNGQKQGGNVASYFCLGDGSVLHAIAGPVDAATLLREARWVVETRKLALFEGRNNQVRYREVIRLAHMERLKEEHSLDLAARSVASFYGKTRPDMVAKVPSSWNAAGQSSLNNQGHVHLLLAQYPMAKIQDIYRTVFEKILKEKVSTLPVQESGS
jgi:hypothetical protein